MNKENNFVGSQNASSSKAAMKASKNAFGATKASGGFGANALEGLGRNSPVWVLGADVEGNDLWMPGSIASIEEETCSVKLETGEVREVSLDGEVVPANPAMLEGIEDLTDLSYLNEPSILHDLDTRYKKDLIYTTAGPVLIAVNPFKKLPELYTQDVKNEYRNKTTADPHVFKVADKAYCNMMNHGQNQGMVISGESGAGKTETTKIAMQYLATLAGGGGMEEQVLQTNPILEAFGNAKTLRNNNSSRFGKLIDINFDRSGGITGAYIETYLLEKSRVVTQTQGERTYHIFYQLCAGAATDPELQQRLRLQDVTEYNFLRSGGCTTIPGVDDAADFQEVRDAMKVIGIEEDVQMQLFQILSAILWLGNIEFQNEPAEVVPGTALSNAAHLLEVSEQELALALTQRSIVTGRDTVIKNLTVESALDGRDALAKSVYSAIFDWLIVNVNTSLGQHKKASAGAGRTISILDIYGFECFKSNSFEQLCINYTNEKLQQLFNQHLFKLEQEEYEKEEIDWTSVEFEDNQVCLDLIEKRPEGILSVLDEQCIMPKATDETFADNLSQRLNANPRYKKDLKNHAVFHVLHYAGAVNYDTKGFLDKNKDRLQDDLLNILRSSGFELLHTLADSMAEASAPKGGAAGGGRGAKASATTVGSRFKGQLGALVNRLNSTAPHFIRCIKPNSLLAPEHFHPALILNQLRCCGVLEVVRISRSGYPTRYGHEDFVERYSFLMPPDVRASLAMAGADAIANCKNITSFFRIGPEMFQVGKTKLFLRAGQIGQMEDMRTRSIAAATVIQKELRCFAARTAFLETKIAAIMSQAVVRGARARKDFRRMKERWYASIVIQAFQRMIVRRREYMAQQKAALMMNLAVRRWVLRRKWKKMEAERLAFEAEEKARLEAEEAARQAHMNAEEKRNRQAELARMREAAASRNAPAASFSAEDVARAAAAEHLANEVEELKAQLAQEQRARAAAEQRCRQLEAGGYTGAPAGPPGPRGGGGAGPDPAAGGGGTMEVDAGAVLEQVDRLVEMEASWGEQMDALLPYLAAARQAAEGKGLPPAVAEGAGLPDRRPLASSGSGRVKQPMPPASPQGSDMSMSVSGSQLEPDSPTSSRNSRDENGRAAQAQRAAAQQQQPGARGPQQRHMQALVSEFEQRTRVYDDDAAFVVEVKEGRVQADMDPEFELKNLKNRFESWKKEFKRKLGDTKVVLKHLGHQEPVPKANPQYQAQNAHLAPQHTPAMISQAQAQAQQHQSQQRNSTDENPVPLPKGAEEKKDKKKRSSIISMFSGKKKEGK